MSDQFKKPVHDSPIKHNQKVKFHIFWGRNKIILYSGIYTPLKYFNDVVHAKTSFWKR